MTSSFDVHSDSFQKILNENSSVEHLATGFGFTEGPIWVEDHLLFSDIPNSRIVQYEVGEEGASISTFRYPSGNSNGLTLDHSGNLIACEHTNRRVSITDTKGDTQPVATRYKGKRLNSPNDVVVKSDGWIYFTDPPYGLMNRTQGKELDFNGVFRVSSNGSGLELLIKDMTGPNGIAFSPDEKKLYVADSLEKFINVYDVDDDGYPTTGNQFAYHKAKGAKRTGGRVDLSAFNTVVHIDDEARLVQVEGLATMETVVRALDWRGYRIPIVPELKHITVGGAIAGIGIESGSFRYGWFPQAMVE